jgi:hypothetical protein
MLIQDVGLTFGRANTFNENATGATNLAAWSKRRVWKTNTGPCVGNLKSRSAAPLVSR